MILLRRKFFNIGVVFFDDKIDNRNVDLIEFYHQNKPHEKIYSREMYSIYINLSRDKESIFNNFSKDTRYEIRRAINVDKVKFEIYGNFNLEILEEFYTFYNMFASQKKIPILKSDRIKKFYEQNKLTITRVLDKSENILCYHVYLTVNDKVRLLYSASKLYDPEITKEYKTLIGRANRALHWNDILYFKDNGYCIYDFGGWYEGTIDIDKIKINKFKQGFGGEIYKYYNYCLPITLKGKLLYKLKRWINS